MSKRLALNSIIENNTDTTQHAIPREWQRLTHIYAILDAAQDENIYKLLMGCTEEFTCLFNGEIPNVLARAAPYLIKIPVRSPIFEQIYQNGFFNNWGIFFFSYESGTALRKHFQSLLRVKTEDGRRLYFRYYDPRVLRTYLPTCTPSELRQFFSFVDTFWAAAEEGESVIEYGKNDDRFYVRTINLNDEVEMNNA